MLIHISFVSSCNIFIFKYTYSMYIWLYLHYILFWIFTYAYIFTYFLISNICICLNDRKECENEQQNLHIKRNRWHEEFFDLLKWKYITFIIKNNVSWINIEARAIFLHTNYHKDSTVLWLIWLLFAYFWHCL